MVVDQRELQSSGRGGGRRAGGGAVGGVSDRSRSDSVGLRWLLQRLTDDDRCRRRLGKAAALEARRVCQDPATWASFVAAAADRRLRWPNSAFPGDGGGGVRWLQVAVDGGAVPDVQRRRRGSDAAAVAAARPGGGPNPN